MLEVQTHTASDGRWQVFPCVPLQGPTCGLHTIVWEPSVKIMQCRKWAFVFLQYRRNFLKCHAVFNPPQGFSSFFGCFQFLPISLFLKVKSQAHFLRKKQKRRPLALSHPPPPHTSACGWSHDQLVRDHVMCGRLLFHSLRAHVKTFFSFFLSFVRKQIIDALKNAAVHCCWQCASVSDLWENDWLLNKVKDRGGGNVLLNMTNTGVGFFCLCCYTEKKGILFFIIGV